ncbi:GGDEF and EAL domain-containing protein [uncultured Deinococcus sp.]|uniref:putative bifunctional diguanylate cyclase/phosphodiesterase n=1 Tax=uncultured Deinococcus sp. TaxID=158789 RepID=UPI002589E586|nr:GGDEF and EAL domain-containing protein [uncultured Deinococcus sp.]
MPRPHLSTDLELSLQEVLDLLRERRVLFWHAEVGQPRVMLYIDDAHLGKWDAGVLWAGLSREDGALLDASLRQVVEEGGCFDVEYPLTYAPGEQRWCHFSGFCPPPEMHLGGPTRLMGLIRDVTAQTTSYARSLEQADLLRGLCEQSMVGITIKDLEGRFILNNSALNSYADRPADSDDLTGQDSTQMFPPELMALVERLDHEALSTGRAAVGEIDLMLAGRPMSLRMSKQPFWRGGEVVGTVSFTTDVTERRVLERRLLEHSAELEARVRERTAELQAINDHLRHTAMHDTLTGLPNRAQLQQWFAERRAGWSADGSAGPDEAQDGLPLLTLLMVDLDHFKRINDRFGHGGGDLLLQQLAGRLRRGLPPGAPLCRLSGDEFVVLLSGVSPAQARQLAETLMAELLRPFTLGGRAVQVGLSIGVTHAWTAGCELRDLLDEADMAMYTGKRSGRGGVRVFEPWMRARQSLLQDLEDDLPGAAERGELSVMFQPVVALGGAGEVPGVEALVRWQHPRYGLIQPDEFISMAEAQGSVKCIDLWVLREAARQVWPLIRAGRVRTLAVNFSAQHFAGNGFPGQLRATLEETGLPPSALVVEITESLFMEDHRRANVLLRDLLRDGVGVAADDFGRGYSSLAKLQHLPLSMLKVDRAFVATSAQFPGIVRSIVEMARSLNLTVVAEGIETPAQLDALRDLGCGYGQGYHLARPMDAPALSAWLAARLDPA